MRPDEIIPIYIVAGFLDSGKTSLIHNMLEDEGFSRGQKTLLIVCEEGMEEYDEEKLKKQNVILHMVDGEEEMTPTLFVDLNRQHRPERVIMEYNNVFKFAKLNTMQLPSHWELVQVITMVDATTYENYMNNMRQLMTDPMQNSDLILFNRVEEGMPISTWRKQLRAMNSAATILFENLDGTVDDGITDEDLPYDMKADVIAISEEQFGLFYVDSMDHPERYDGKKVRLVGQAWKRREFPKGYYYFARRAMTCCSNDIAPCGWVCKGDRTPDNKTYFTLTASCRCVQGPDGQTALMLNELSTERAKTPREELVNFVNL